MEENIQQALDYLLLALNQTNNWQDHNHIVRFIYMDRVGCKDVFGRELPDCKVVRPVWSDCPDRSDGYYDINVECDNCMGVLLDVMGFIRKKF